MKVSKQLILTSAVFTASIIGLRAQDTTVTLTPQAVTFALTSKAFVGGTFEVDPDTGKPTKIPAFESTVETLDKNGNVTKRVTTSAAKAVTGKLGNAEILNAIKDDLLGGSISGWSIVVQSDEEGNPQFLATKKNADSVELGDLISADLPGSGAYSEVETYTATYDKDGNTTKETTAYASSGTVEGAVDLTVNGAELTGYFVQPYKGLTYNPDSTDKSIVELVNIPGAAKVTGVLGSKEDENGSVIYQGSINVAAATGKVIKLQ